MPLKRQVNKGGQTELLPPAEKIDEINEQFNQDYIEAVQAERAEQAVVKQKKIEEPDTTNELKEEKFEAHTLAILPPITENSFVTINEAVHGASLRPFIGDVVLYMSDQERTLGRVLPAIVVEVRDNGKLWLHVITGDNYGHYNVANAPHSVNPVIGTWHFKFE